MEPRKAQSRSKSRTRSLSWTGEDIKLYIQIMLLLLLYNDTNVKIYKARCILNITKICFCDYNDIKSYKVSHPSLWPAECKSQFWVKPNHTMARPNQTRPNQTMLCRENNVRMPKNADVLPCHALTPSNALRIDKRETRKRRHP